ncbi:MULTISPECIES: hypothetical protein [unclassified Paenibacillus]|uniref:hypothetical protein n=1 Tax=unclassified Paenibacillus TaxID=185978 RepID=UPI00363316C2
METGLIKKMKSKLAASLAAFLLAANVVPAEKLYQRIFLLFDNKETEWEVIDIVSR